MAQALLTNGSYPHSVGEYVVSCGDGLSLKVRKNINDVEILVKKGRSTITISLQQWRTLCNLTPTLEMVTLLLDGKLEFTK